MAKTKNQHVITSRPPVVAVLGHVDHGKTSLLDFIRKSTVAAKEFGGITQHIGAYQVELPNEKKTDTSTPKFITFIDTPGHEAFAKMRSRGATAADIAILVVAADDSVKPQTIESIQQIKEAGVSLIVAVNKIDLQTANVQKVKQDLAKHSVQLEGFGGDVPFAEVSAKSGKGVKELLELIMLVWEMKEPVVVDPKIFSGNVIETQVDKGKGVVATVIVKNGVLTYGSKLFEDAVSIGKVRALNDEWGKPVKVANPGKPVQVLGFTQIPKIGSVITDQPHAAVVTPQEVSNEPKVPFVPDFLKPLNEIEQKLVVLLKTDTAGSMEAIRASLSDKIVLVSSGFGDITEADIMDARASHAFIVGFNVSIKSTAIKLAETEKVVYRTYTIIYELLDELADVVTGMKEVVTGEREVGQATIIAEFPFDKDRIAGVKVTDGRMAKGDWVKFMRDDLEVGRARIKTIRQGKLEATKVEAGNECGLLFDKNVAFLVKDGIIAVIK